MRRTSNAAWRGIAQALVLLLSVGILYWIILVFTLWVLLISIHILLANLGPSDGEFQQAA